MIEQVFKMLDRSKYHVIEHENEIEIAQISINTLGQKWVDPEYIIKIIFQGEKTCIAYYYRDKKCDAIEASTISEMLCGIIVMCYKHLNSLRFEPSFSEELRTNLKNKEIDNAITTVQQKVPRESFCIFEKKENAVCLLKTNNEFIVEYYSKSFQKKLSDIIEIDEVTRAFMVLFNYSYKLKLFNDIYNKMVELNFIENDCEETYNYYLNIYL